MAHRIVQVEHDLRLPTAKGVADDVVHLLLAAGADAAPALDAGVEVHGDRGMRQVLWRLMPRLEARRANRQLPGPPGEL
jgi:hypothetical protein